MKVKKVIKDNKLLLDIINVFLGMIVIVLFVLVIMFPKNLYLMSSLLIVAGIMNLTNGYRKITVFKQKSIGYFFCILGVLVSGYGLYYLRLAFA
ncbi:MAG TPA: hypothetical protein VHQ24_08895 [Lachnospiraceae bacterium]|nr:hypothetical protein [Lachnospiraceae bacterium]